MMDFTNAPPPSSRGAAEGGHGLRSSSLGYSESLRQSGNLRSSREGEMTSAMQARVSDEWLELIAEIHPEVLYLDLTKSYRLTDGGVSTFLPSPCRGFSSDCIPHYVDFSSRSTEYSFPHFEQVQAPHGQIFPRFSSECVRPTGSLPCLRSFLTLPYRSQEPPRPFSGSNERHGRHRSRRNLSPSVFVSPLDYGYLAHPPNRPRLDLVGSELLAAE